MLAAIQTDIESGEIMHVQIGKKVPAWKVPATGDQVIKSKDLAGQNIVLYFYPRDNTSGCTTEAQDFRDQIKQFAKLNTVVLGVSKDSLKSHDKFKDKQLLPFDLLSDEEEKLCQLFDVIKLKKMYGKEFEGIERSTFVIDGGGVLRNEWRKVKVKGHVDQVLEAVVELTG